MTPPFRPESTAQASPEEKAATDRQPTVGTPRSTFLSVTAEIPARSANAASVQRLARRARAISRPRTLTASIVCGE
jgi:hypothetical protein